jgi:hypothetical protein
VHADGQVLGHVALLDGLDDGCLQCVAPLCQLSVAVQLGPTSNKETQQQQQQQQQEQQCEEELVLLCGAKACALLCSYSGLALHHGSRSFTYIRPSMKWAQYEMV